MTGLAWRLARRELRAGLRGFRIFLACLALGVAAIAGVGSLGQAMQEGLRADGRRLLGGDVDLRTSQQEAGPDQLAWLKNHSAALSRTVSMRAMALTPDGSGRALVELKAVDEAYPLVGTLGLEPPREQPLANRDGAWGAVADASLLRKLGLGVGASVRVGEATIVIGGILVSEPDRVASVFDLGPRLLVSRQALAATGLERPGSQIHYHYRVLLPPGVESPDWIAALEQTFPKAGWRVRGTDQAAPGIRRFIERMTLFLGFVGLTSLLVGGMGVGNAVTGYLETRTATIATFKCLGAPGALVARIYLTQILLLAVVGIAAGVVVGAAVSPLAAWALAGWLPVSLTGDIHWGQLGQAAVFGLVTSLAFALWPLGRAQRIPAASLFRLAVTPLAQRPAPAFVWATGIGITGLVLLTFFTAGDRGFAAWFVGGTVATLLALRGGAAVIMALARRLHGRSAPWRLVLANLHRPGASTPGVVVSLGTGLSVLVAVTLIEGNLSRQIEQRLPEEAPTFFFIDIQPDQVADFDAVMAAIPEARDYRRMPSLRGRIVAIDGRPVDQVAIAADSEWAVRGDRTLTYSPRPEEGAEIVAGAWWPEDYQGPPLISFDAGVARGFGVGVGDSLTLNVMGRDIEARIASLREIDWHSLRFDFAIIFSPGLLEAAPHGFIAAVAVPPTSEDALERAVSDRFGNVSIIRVREALVAAAGMLEAIGGVVRGISLPTLLAGALVLAGIMAAGQRRRVADAVVFKVLGATRRRILVFFLLEYGILGLVTGVVAAGVGAATSWAVVTGLMGMGWQLLPDVILRTVGLCIVITLLTGVVGTWHALTLKPAPLLRNE